jgi:hypothetical protein
MLKWTAGAIGPAVIFEREAVAGGIWPETLQKAGAGLGAQVQRAGEALGSDMDPAIVCGIGGCVQVGR